MIVCVPCTTGQALDIHLFNSNSNPYYNFYREGPLSTKMLSKLPKLKKLLSGRARSQAPS